ncbi:hypothetical protein GOA97_01930 [Sinorhizobium meliloti]|nr:hypothetical protein [Sinorhizobium meliloti]MDW9653267.1 hypothetical protein [Sinorhizobium meliloti]MDW9913231.1 hypothetical protein [Sinorhizobium meliloti]MDW9940069.1 hypothetical protein [Sinorhizobium meliloti]MDW9944333.1 hypothetical protein [Sinorhizobium meliloti]
MSNENPNRITIVATSGTEPRAPTTEEYGFMNMTADQRRDYIDQMEHASAKAAHDAKENALQADIARATELSVANNPQLQAQRMGVTTNRVVSSREVGMIAPPEVVSKTPVRFNGIEISGQQAKDMVTYGQWSEGEYRKALSEALAVHGYKAPGNFR